MDAGMDGVNDEEEADKIYGQICDEIGVDINEEQQVNKQKIAQANQPAGVVRLPNPNNIWVVVRGGHGRSPEETGPAQEMSDSYKHPYIWLIYAKIGLNCYILKYYYYIQLLLNKYGTQR